MASRDQIEDLADRMIAQHGERLDRMREQMFRLIDAGDAARSTTADAEPQTTESLTAMSPVRDGVLCVFSCACVAASDGQPITVIATRTSAVDRHEEETTPTDDETLSFARALLGEAWFSLSLRDRSEVGDPARATRGVRLYLSSDFQPGVPEVLSASLIATVETLD